MTRTAETSHTDDSATLTGYLSAPGFEAQLTHELSSNVVSSVNGLLIAPRQMDAPAWVSNVWHDPIWIYISSIGDAAAKLRAIQRNWTLHPGANYRRARLIAERLPRVSAKPIEFGASPPSSPLGSWTLVDNHTLIAAPHCSSPFPNGEYRFIENRSGPPSRAYLKLWEALTRFGQHPNPEDVCIDLGASPGGWSWVLAGFGATVFSIDKAPLAPNVASLPNVHAIMDSAFSISPATYAHATWVLSDVICYPARLYSLVERWIAAGCKAKMIMTLKFQGETDFETISKFKAIPESMLVHLSHNKHELTWFRT